VIYYNVWFSFNSTADESEELSKVLSFLQNLKKRNLIAGFETRRLEGPERFHVRITFVDDDQFAKPFAEVAKLGVHGGSHGMMIKQVTAFRVSTERE